MEQRNVHIEQSPHNKHDLFGAPRYTEMLNRMQQHLTNKKHCKASLNFVSYSITSLNQNPWACRKTAKNSLLLRGRSTHLGPDSCGQSNEKKCNIRPKRQILIYSPD